MRKQPKGLLTILALLMLAVSLPVWAGAAGPDNGGGAFETAQDLNGKRVGVQTGTTFDAIVREALPEAQISYFNTTSDLAAALEAKKIDAFPSDEPVLRLMAAENGKLAILEDRLDNFEFGFVLPKTAQGAKLRDELNEWIAAIRASGELEEIVRKWTDGTEEEKTVPDYALLPAPNGILHMVTEGAYAPMNYYRGSELVGMEIDMAARFCEKYGYGLSAEAMNFDGILPAIQAGKADFSAAAVSITEERKESVYFSDPYYEGGTMLAVLKTEPTAGQSAEEAETADEPESEPVTGGSPWRATVVVGNLPVERPALKDDLYTYFNYDYLKAHQDVPSFQWEDYSDDMVDAVRRVLKDESVSNHELEQLRIFYSQALDRDTLREQGISELLPYLERIESVRSLEELNALLTARDFPFSPFFIAPLTVLDTRDRNIVTVYPNFFLYDALLYEGKYYSDLEDPYLADMRERILMYEEVGLIQDFSLLGMEREEADRMLYSLVDFEGAYGQYIGDSSDFNSLEFGAIADAKNDNLVTFEDLGALCPNIPLQGILTKLGKGRSPCYSLAGKDKEWLKALNDLWTEENLETLKRIAETKLFLETRLYRDTSAEDAYWRELLDGWSPIGDDAALAFEACSSQDCFGQVLAKTYVDTVLGERAVERMSALSRGLVDCCRELVDETAWLGEESRARILDKLDHMQLNVLRPKEGYFDYGGLELTPSEEGGTLLGNYLKLKQYRYDRESELVGQNAIASSIWFLFSPTLRNAFYASGDNSINIFPGYINRAVYSDDMDDCTLIGTLGFTIAHEISHSLSYLGAQFGPYGEGEPIFTGDDLEAFAARTDRLAAYYGSIEAADGVSPDGKTVVGEAVADLCGLQIALRLAEKTEGFDYTEFFRAFADMWAGVFDETAFWDRVNDVHALNNLRVNVNAQMLDEVYEAFGIEEGDGMYLAPEKRILILGPDAA